MPVEIPADLPPELAPLAWMLGRWEGAGVGASPERGEFRFGQEVVARSGRHDSGPAHVAWESRTWLLDDAGGLAASLGEESGYWRPQAGNGLEVVLAHSSGVVEVYLGELDGARAELRSDVVARTETGEPYAAGHRLYGLVEGDLLWAWDRAVGGAPLAPAFSARLKRVGAG